MSRAAILLRIVLSVALVLNGIGGSLAAAQMAVGSQTISSATPVAPAVAHSGCHEHASMPHHHPSPAAETPSGKAPAGHSDCCGVGMCGCACAQLPSLAAIELLIDPPKLELERLSDALASTHAAPALPHLIRPPIA